jgi:MscS family membrane protein
MNNFFDQEFFNNTIRDYLWVAGVIVLVLLLNRVISKYIAIFLSRIFKRGWKTFNQQEFVDLIVHPLSIFFVVSISIIALYRLNFPPALNFTIYKYPLQKVFLSIGVAVQIIAFTWLMLRSIDFIASLLERRANLTAAQSDNQLIVFFRDFLKVIIGIVGGMMVLHFAFEYDVSSLLTGLSIVGAAIALALRESLENLIASFVIFFDKPFTSGDTVKVQGITGIVEKIGLRSTRIRSDQKTYVTVPNKQMVDSILDNQSLRTQQRNELLLQLSLDTPSFKLEELSSELKNFLSTIKEIQTYNVLFTDINLQAYTLMIEFFVPAAYLSQFNLIKQKVNFFALKTIERLEIRIAGRPIHAPVP